MKKLAAAALILGSYAGPGAAQQAARVPQSPEVLADRRVTFRLLAPKVTEVRLLGEFMTGEKALQKDDTGLWSITIGPLEPEMYHYNFIIDGVRTIDPANPSLKTGTIATTTMSIVEVRGDGPAFYDGQSTPHGEIHTHWYPSKSIGSLRRVTVYTPPGYDGASRTRYPALYLFHGANADETAWTRFGRVNMILDNLLAAGKIKPFIVVMPFGYGVPPGSGLPGDSSALFTRDLIEDVIPFVQAQYRIDATRDRRAIAGLSMGGGQSLTIGLNHPELFSHVAGFSAALRGDFEKTFAAAVANPQETNHKFRLLWFGCGKDDSLFAPAQGFDAFLSQHKIAHTFRPTEGAHTWMVWRRYLNEVAPLLFR